MSTAPSIDLSRLQLPDLGGEPISDPRPDEKMSALERVFKETISKRENGIRNKLNEVANSVLLATARGGELDQIAAFYGIKRLQVTPADPDASPPVPVVMEVDERLRLRARLSLQAMSQSGCEGAYLFHALSASAHIKDISVFNEDLKPEKINIVVLSDSGRGDGTSGEEGEQEILKRVRQAMAIAASVTDEITVRWATIEECPVEAKLQIKAGVNAEKVLRAVEEKVVNLLHDNHRLGKNILRNEFYSAMYQPGVESVELKKPKRDIAVGIDRAPFNDADEVMIQPDPDVNGQPNADSGFVSRSRDSYVMEIRSSEKSGNSAPSGVGNSNEN